MVRRIAVIVACMAVLSGCNWDKQRVKVNPTRARIDARTMLIRAGDDADPVTRTHAIEALDKTLGAQAGGVFKQGLSDPNPLVQYAAAMAVGDTKYAPAKGVLVEMAKKAGPDKRVYSAVLYALHELGDDTRTGDLQRLLFHREKEVRASAAAVMGKMGEPSAIGLLKDLLFNERDPGVKFQVTESLAMLGDEASTQRIEAYTKGYFVDLRLVAIPAVGRLNLKHGPYILQDLLKDKHPRVRVAAASALAKIGKTDEASYQYCVRALEQPRKVFDEATKGKRKVSDIEISSLQGLAAQALGRMYHYEAVDVLHPFLSSRDGRVRVAAAMSILKLLTDAAPPPTRKTPKTSEPRKKPPKRGPGVIKPKFHTSGGKD